MNETLDRRLRSLPGTARRALATRAGLRDWRDALAGVRSPEEVGRALLSRLRTWQPNVHWALAVVGGSDRPTLVAAPGSRLSGRAALTALAEATLGKGDHVAVGSLRTLVPRGPGGAAIGWLLKGRQDQAGVLLGWIDEPAAEVSAGSAIAKALHADVLLPVGLALEVAVRIGRFRQLAAIDDLTGLCNARHLHQVIAREIHRLARTSRPVSLLFLDLDAFKRVNDSHGHLMGSRTLVEFGILLQGCTRATDTVARYGGDEFVVVLPETARREARGVARRVQERMASAVFLQACGLQVRLTVSVGVATLARGGKSAADLIRMADQAMYWVKHHGRDGIRVASSTTRTPRGSGTT